MKVPKNIFLPSLVLTGVFAMGLSTAWSQDGWVWRQVESGTSADLRAVSFDASDFGVAVGHESTVLRFDGEKWQPVGGEIQDMESDTGAVEFPGTPDQGGWGPDARFEAVTVVSSDQFWVGSYGMENDQRGYAFWNGSSWSPRDKGSSQSRRLALWSDGSSLVLGGGGAPGIINRFDGNEWKIVFVATTGFYRSIDGQRDSALWACGHVESGPRDALVPRMLIYSLDEGMNWQPHPQIQADPAASQAWNALSSLSDSALWVVGNRGSYLIWDGTSVSTGIALCAAGQRQNLHGVLALDSSRVWAVGAKGTALFWNGQDWNPILFDFPVDGDLYAITKDSSGHLWIVGDHGVILHGQPAAP
jgi:hypothetical protein